MNEVLKRFIMEVLVGTSRAFFNLHFEQHKEADSTKSYEDQNITADNNNASKAEH